MNVPAGLLELGIALVIGLVIGAEREQRIAAEPTARRTAGIRTFALVGMLGAVASLLGPAALVGFGIVVALFTLAGYALDARLEPGLTSEVALVLTYALGALAMTHGTLALSLGVTTALLLAFRSRIHAMVRDIVSPAELRDALIVAGAAIVVLPALPNEPIDPWGVLVPFTLWRLVVLVLLIHFGAHVAQRVLGPRWGPPLAGLASGFVSSSATIHAMGKEAREPAASPSATATAAASTVATYVETAILVGAASPTVLERLALPLATATLTALLFAGWFAYRAARSPNVTTRELDRAVNLRGALLFACAVTAVSIGATFVERAIGAPGVLVGAGLAALVDAHASAASVAALDTAGTLSTDAAAAGVLVCLSANALTKLGLAIASRASRSFQLAVLAQVVAATLASWIVLALR
jgi:uncharacterized membrane protein (DUF4010 family)